MQTCTRRFAQCARLTGSLAQNGDARRPGRVSGVTSSERELPAKIQHQSSADIIDRATPELAGGQGNTLPVSPYSRQRFRQSAFHFSSRHGSEERSEVQRDF